MFIPLFLVLLGVLATFASSQSTYIAAVAEHDVFMGSDTDTAEYKLSKNLDLYEGLVKLARGKGVQMLVFPEFGLVPAEQNGRASLYPFAEKIGNVVNNNASVASVPCSEPETYANRPILRRMSCAAKENQVAILVNMIDWIDCDSSTDENCPNDGHYQYNTNVVFDEAGRLIVKYHKSHEFPTLQVSYDVVPEPSEVVYESSFGVKFGIFTCFDIMFPDPAVKLRKQGISHFLYPVQQGELGEASIIPFWSKQQKAILLSANLGAGEGVIGGDCSGILSSGEPLPSEKVHLRDVDKRFLTSPDNLLIAPVPF